MRILIAAILIVFVTAPAYAFEPDPGNRAYPIIGTDMISGDVISLEDHQGEWVLLCFWTSWCGGCVRRIPLLNELWEESLINDDFTIITVACDDMEYTPQLRKILKEKGVKFPVLHYLDGEEGGFFDYDIRYFGTNVLIDPQGVIFSDIWVREDLPEVISYLDSNSAVIPRIAINAQMEQMEDQSFKARIDVSSSDHSPLELGYGGWYEFNDPDAEMEYFYEASKRVTEVVEFQDFGMYSLILEFPKRDDLERAYFYSYVDIAGTEALYDGKGMSCISDSDLRFDQDGVLQED